MSSLPTVGSGKGASVGVDVGVDVGVVTDEGPASGRGNGAEPLVGSLGALH